MDTRPGSTGTNSRTARAAVSCRRRLTGQAYRRAAGAPTAANPGLFLLIGPTEVDGHHGAVDLLQLGLGIGSSGQHGHPGTRIQTRSPHLLHAEAGGSDPDLPAQGDD